jgi:hypothetical protein
MDASHYACCEYGMLPKLHSGEQASCCPKSFVTCIGIHTSFVHACIYVLLKLQVRRTYSEMLENVELRFGPKLES